MLPLKSCLSTFLNHFSLLITCLLLSNVIDAQNAIWTPVSKEILSKEKAANFQAYQLFQLDEVLFLEKASNTIAPFSKQTSKPIFLPLPNGKQESFKLIVAPIIADKLGKKYPDIQSYQVVSNKNSLLQGRVNWTVKGFYGHLIDNGHSFFIEKIDSEDYDNLYLVYRESDLKTTDIPRLVCGNNSLNSIKKINNQFEKKTSIEANLKTFRIAITATEGFTTITGGTIESTLSAIINSLASLNVIYEKDLGVRFVLHENNDQLIFTNEHPAPFSNPESAFGLWEEHSFLLDSLLGNNSYDLGHVFATECSGGVAGVAALAGVCSMENKANAVSCVFNDNIAEFRKTLYHEIGHQLGANHTWSNCGFSVNESQRHAPTAVEPGGGSTIMSYGGVCGPFDIVASAQDNLHGLSIQEIESTLARDSISCNQQISMENTPPIVSVRASGFTIPMATPFELEALAFDEENSVLTYSWEQFDTGVISDIGFPVEDAPSFRSFTPSRESKRIFPKATDIILNKSSNVEVLPDTTRKLTFGVTVRDNHEGGGSTTFAEVVFFSTAEAGPFLVLHPDSANIAYEKGDSIEVVWAVANTDDSPVNCSNVDVYLSFDNGKEFPKLLASSIPNNGITKVLLPDTTTTRARIKVKCSDNIFFDMSNNRFKIVESLISSTKNIYEKTVLVYPNPANDKVIIKFPEILPKGIFLEVFDALGRNILNKKTTQQNDLIVLNTNRLQNGVYLIKARIGEQIFSKRFIIQK